MMLKLYRDDGSSTLYWEAWDDEQGGVTVHTGTVGQRGESTTIALADDSTPDAVIKELAEQPLAAGYRARDDEEHAEIVVQFAVEGWGAPKDIDFREAVHHELSEALGWTGNGHCDGGDIGSGTINLFLFAVDADLATTTIRARSKPRAGSTVRSSPCSTTMTTPPSCSRRASTASSSTS